jgi:hypothetical protein
MSAWSDLVSKIFKENKSKPGYLLKDAMKEAKKIYVKSGASAAPHKEKTKKRKGTKKSRKHGKKSKKSRKMKKD